MDRGALRATSVGLPTVGHDLVNKQQNVIEEKMEPQRSPQSFRHREEGDFIGSDPKVCTPHCLPPHSHGNIFKGLNLFGAHL